jgi:phosphate transport system substrate-binding protein
MKKRYKILSIGLPTFISVVAVFILIRCTGTSAPKETTTQGNIKIVSDESFQPIVDSQVSVFTSLYPNAHITPEYKPENELISDFINDSVKVIVSSWQPTEDQKKVLRASLTEVRTSAVAYDAIALIINKKNTDTLITYENVRDIFQGKIKTWKEINPESKLGEISVIFDNEKSGNIRYFKEKFDLTGNLPEKFYAVKNNPEVIDYVNKTPNSMGIISVNWISDKDDSLAMSFINKIKVLAVSMPVLDEEYYYPLQGSIYDKSYPFTREVYMVTRENFYGLGSGFIAFVASAQGQRIFLKSGLVPATMPVRLMTQVKNH